MLPHLGSMLPCLGSRLASILASRLAPIIEARSSTIIQGRCPWMFNGYSCRAGPINSERHGALMHLASSILDAPSFGARFFDAAPNSSVCPHASLRYCSLRQCALRHLLRCSLSIGCSSLLRSLRLLALVLASSMLPYLGSMLPRLSSILASLVASLLASLLYSLLASLVS
jgi:hypothetical protein